ncbi:MAG: hypothetical protein J6P09_02670 [Methanobrevibacter sp.]|nr:hypothetical protein [Methanobrevibacter sp.]
MKMEIDVTDGQAEKIQTLRDNDISVGEAIDILFEMKESIEAESDMLLESRIKEASEKKAELEKEIEDLDKQMSVLDKLKDASLDVGQKQKIVEKEYGQIDKTFDEVIMDAKHKFRWSSNLFKF